MSSSQSKSKQTGFPRCLMPIGSIQHQDTKSAVLTNSSALVASVVNWEWRWQPQQNLLNSVLSPIHLPVSLNAKVLVVVVKVDCVPGCWSQVPTFICYSPPPLTQNASKGLSNQFSGTCTIIQIKYVCQNCVNCPSIRTDLTTRVLGFASYPALGTRDPYLYWGGWHSMATHYLIGIAWYTIDWHANLFAKKLC